MQAQAVRVGCSGWQYRHWKGNFYPSSLPQKKWLDYYASQFDTVEINNSFYRLPTEKSFSEWRDRVPDHFLYAVKASRYLTHIKRLKDPADPLHRFWNRARLLGSKLGPVLYQLPPHLNETRSGSSIFWRPSRTTRCKWLNFEIQPGIPMRSSGRWRQKGWRCAFMTITNRPPRGRRSARSFTPDFTGPTVIIKGPTPIERCATGRPGLQKKPGREKRSMLISTMTPARTRRGTRECFENT